MRVTVDKFGRILIPKKLRDLFGLKPGSEVKLQSGEEGLLLSPIGQKPAMIEDGGLLVFSGELTEDIETAMEDLREERLQRLGGG